MKLKYKQNFLIKSNYRTYILFIGKNNVINLFNYAKESSKTH